MSIWVVLNENVKQANILWTMRENMFESRNSAGAAEKLPETKTISPWSYDMEGHAKKCVERFCELANKTTQQFYKVATPCIDDHQLKEEEIGSVGQLSTVCSHIVLKMSTFRSYR